MIALHALWSDKPYTGLHVWGETSDAPLRRASPRRKTADPRALQPHPFAAADGAVLRAVEGLVPEQVGTPAVPGQIAVWLPTVSGAPMPSPDVILNRARTGVASEAPELRAWIVPALLFDPALALDLLAGLPAEPPPGVAFGSSLQFWAEAARFALELATRQSFAPALEHDGEAYHAAWRVVLLGEDEDRAGALARAMPPACRAGATEGQDAPADAAELLSSFLHHTVDKLARGTLAASQWPAPNRKHKPRSTLERWLQALASDESALEGTPDELQTFAGQLQGWLDQLAPAVQHAPFRTCFRLSEPDDEQERHTWQLDFNLQANDDRSLLVPADRVWRETSPTLTFLKRRFENPQERLLEDLGRAARLFPRLDESLNTARPIGLALDAEGAYGFLRETAPLLEQAGYGVMLPAWWQKKSAQLGVKLKLHPKKGPQQVNQGLMGQNAVVAYDWQIALGDQALTFQEFQALASLKVPLVKVRGQWVELQTDEIERAIAFFKRKHSQGEMDLSDALRIGLGQETSEAGLPVVAVEGEGWVGDLLRSLSDQATLPVIEQPATFVGQLRPYQLRGVSWMAFLLQRGLGACLADDMGLGKTPALIAWLLWAYAESNSHGPALLVCPMSIVGNWQRELARFAPSLKVMVHHGAERLSGQAFEDEVRQNDVVLTTYSLAHRDETHLARVAWDSVVLDEAQNIKNPSAKQTQAIRRLDACHRIALTGTPVENRLSELWSIMDFLNRGYLGTAKDFHTRFANPIERYRDADKSETLKRLIQPFVLRRLKTDKTIIADLPDKLEMKVLCNLTQEQATLYQAVVNDMLAKIEDAQGIERRGLVLATLMKLKQVCNHPAHFLGDGSALPGRSGKLERLEEMLEEALATGDKALIFTQFAEMGEVLRSHLQQQFGREALFLHGGTTRKQRDEMVQRFQGGPRGPALFILSIKAGGVGLNLTAANRVFHFDRWWNPAVENQATDRAFRIGQTRNVLVHKFCCVGTLEERIDLMIEQKKDLAERIVGAGEGWLTEMSTDQLRDLFKLGQEAVGN